MIQRTHHTMRTALLVAGMLVPAIAVAQHPTPGPAGSYDESVVRQAVEEEIRKSGKSPSDLRIEIIGDPDYLDGHALLHRRVTEPTVGRAMLSGRVVHSNWEIAAGIRIFLSSPRDAGVPPSTVTTTSGEFQFPDIAPGEYVLRADGSSDVKRVTLTPGRKRILVPLGDSSDVYSIFDDVKERPPIVVARVFRGDKLEMLYYIDLSSSPPDVQPVDASELSGDGEFGAASFPTAAESKQLTAEIAPFLTALLDPTRGPERLKPFLSSRIVCRPYYSGTRLIPSIDDARCAMSLLDSFALRMWFEVEGAKEYPEQLLRDWYDEDRTTTDEQRLAVSQRRHEILWNELRDAGMLEPEHASRVQKYFREAIAAMPILKVNVSEPQPEFPLPKGELYLLPMPLFLIREGNELHVVGTMIGGG